MLPVLDACDSFLSDSAVALLHVEGLMEGVENSDISGVYVYLGLHHDRAAYHLIGSNATVLRYQPGNEIWVISRAGFTGDLIVAWATEVQDPVGGIWNVWSYAEQQF